MEAGAVREFEAHRSRMFGLAYRMLGSAQEAEDVVQDAFLRWNGAAHDAIGVPSAWLAKVVTNLCLNRLTSARVQREQYIGTWLPEPVLTSGGMLGPMETAEQRESVSLAFLVLLERLTPTERAVFVLREAFGYSHREIAEIAGLTEANSRQLHHRARQQLSESPKRSPLDRGHWRDLVERFLAAAREGDLRGLEQLLAADVTSWADGGGNAPAARRPVLGRARVARYLMGAMGKLPVGVRVAMAEVNGEPAVLGWLGGRVFGAGVLEIRDGQISALRIIANPGKLGFAARQAVALSDLGLSDLGLSHPDGPVGS